MSAGAPAAAKESNTALIRGSWVPVVSLPSENVPAPPSPNWTLERSLSAPVPPGRGLHVPHPLLHGPSLLQHGARHTAPGKIEGTEMPAPPWPTAHHHGPLVRLPPHRRKMVALALHRLDLPQLPRPQDGRLLGQIQLNGIDQLDLDLFPGRPPTGGRCAPHPAPKQGVSAAWRACGAGLPHPPPRSGEYHSLES